MKKTVGKVAIAILAILAITIGTSFFGYNKKNNNVLVIQFGQIVDVKEDAGVYFKLPIIQKAQAIFVGEQLYDLPVTDVITSDKKSMTADCYVTWQITDPKLYYQAVSSESVAQGRINVAVYNSLKNVVSSTSQDDIINGKDGSLGTTILEKISMSQYGIEITNLEIKVLDLPDENKQAVYTRMISERNAIAAEYRANGERDAKNIRSAADAEVRTIVSEAQVIAAKTKSEGESEYFKILADAYGSSLDRREFYNFIIGIDALQESLKNGGTITIDENSPIYSILINQQKAVSYDSSRD